MAIVSPKVLILVAILFGVYYSEVLKCKVVYQVNGTSKKNKKFTRTLAGNKKFEYLGCVICAELEISIQSCQIGATNVAKLGDYFSAVKKEIKGYQTLMSECLTPTVVSSQERCRTP